MTAIAGALAGGMIGGYNVGLGDMAVFEQVSSLQSGVSWSCRK
mgnify:CR=1 FL=1